MASPNNIQRGDVIRVNFNPVLGSEQAGERPAVVLSPTFHCQHSRVIIVAAVTSRKIEKIYPFEALLDPAESGLPVPSKVMLTHIRSIDKTRITGHYGALSRETLARVETALKYATGLSILHPS